MPMGVISAKIAIPFLVPTTCIVLTMQIYAIPLCGTQFVYSNFKPFYLNTQFVYPKLTSFCFATLNTQFVSVPKIHNFKHTIYVPK